MLFSKFFRSCCGRRSAPLPDGLKISTRPRTFPNTEHVLVVFVALLVRNGLARRFRVECVVARLHGCVGCVEAVPLWEASTPFPETMVISDSSKALVCLLWGVSQRRRQGRWRIQHLFFTPTVLPVRQNTPSMRRLLTNNQPSVSRKKKHAMKRDITVGKIPGVVYSNNTASGKGARGETFFVKVDKLVVDREIRRLKASFDNTVSYCTA